jgi:hypothetical protein
MLDFVKGAGLSYSHFQSGEVQTGIQIDLTRCGKGEQFHCLSPFRREEWKRGQRVLLPFEKRYSCPPGLFHSHLARLRMNSPLL